MAKQLHKQFSNDQVVFIMEKYLSKEIDFQYALSYLKLKRSRFFDLLREYRNNPDKFTIQYQRQKSTRKIDEKIEKNIINELREEKALIEDKDIPIKRYNYSAIKDNLIDKYNQKVSLSTIINRAKNNDFYLTRKEGEIHDQEVITNYTGELLQHDSSYHRWSPYADKKWYLITTIDDFSRYLLYAEMIMQETTWNHILALESVVLRYGCPFKYYPDQHSIFRYVKERDKNSPWANYSKFTDDVDPQWKQVVKDCGIDITYALSPQAKGKIERPYQWLQDRIVRRCAKDGIKDFTEVQKILKQEVYRYNHRQVHSATKEIPIIRFERAVREGKSMFREFEIKKPFISTKDIFCLKTTRIIDAYRKISLDTLQLRVPGVLPRNKVEIRMIPDIKKQIVELRFWFEDKLVSVQTVRSQDLKIVRF